MYCINCGVKLGESEKKCPLCGLVPYHPELPQPELRPLYPANQYPPTEVRPKVAQAIMLVLFLLPMILCLQIDLRVNRSVVWSGYVIGALTVTYVCLVLPWWFRRPNPVIFVPCGFAAVIGYLLYINLAMAGSWFLSFAFPVAGGVGLIVTALVTLLRYVRGGKLFVWGGTFMALGGFMLLVEFLLTVTFPIRFAGWSIYPLSALVLLGGFLIYLAINSAAREMMERKLFI